MSQMEIHANMASADWPTADDEGDLIARARSDRDAFATLYRRHYRLLADHVYRRTGDAHATEDIVADVFLTVLRTLPRYRYRGVPVRFWLLRIATNAVNHWARRLRRHPTVALEPEQLSAADADESRDHAADPQRTQQALLALPPKFQAVLSLHYFESLSVAEIAAVIGCRVGTVKSRLARAREALREKLTPQSEVDHA
jgi:RNA polymerase sigma-70 factor, ECF subfamily